MPDRSTVITPPGDTAWVYDPQHDALRFVSKTNGALYTYSLSQGAFTGPLSIGGTPDSIAISPDGQWLVVGNQATITVGGTTEAVITRVNLATSAIDQVMGALPYSSKYGGVAYIAVDARGAVIFDTLSGMYNTNSFHTFSVAAASPTVQDDAAFIEIDDAHANFSQRSYILSSPDHKILLIQDPRGAPSFQAVYDASSNALTAINRSSRDVGEMARGFQSGRGDVANNGLIIDVTYEDVKVFDKNLHLIHDLSSYTGSTYAQIVDAAFSQDAREIFLWDAAKKTVFVVDTQTWAQIGTLTTTIGGAESNFNDGPAQSMQLVDNGTLLALNDGAHVELIDLTARLNLTAGPPPSSPDPSLPVTPSFFNADAGATISGDMDRMRLSDLLHATITQADSSAFSASGPGAIAIRLNGDNLTYANNQLVGGTIVSGSFTDVQGGVTLHFDFASSTGWSAPQFVTWLVHNDTAGAFQTLLAGKNGIGGSTADDLIHGYAGDDKIEGLGGNDTLLGGAGNDLIFATAPSGLNEPTAFGPAGSTWLRGEDGDDYIVGGQGFDNINGNTGNDTESGGAGNDWVVGGQGNDMIFGETGDDVLNGNLGNDTCVGGQGNDWVRGGQGDDLIFGGDGNDWLSGDRGNDTLTGGAGADVFHVSTGGGIDRVTDFNAAEGDRVQLDPGTTYSVHQSGADTVVDLGGGDQVILVGVQANTLPSGWLFFA